MEHVSFTRCDYIRAQGLHRIHKTPRFQNIVAVRPLLGFGADSVSGNSGGAGVCGGNRRAL